MTAASNEVVAVIQADRDMVQAFHRLRLNKLMEAIKDEKAGARLGEDEGDAGDLVQAFARHRIAHSDPRPVAEGLREAAQRVVDDYPAAAGACASIEGGDGKPGWGSIRRLAEALATHSPALMAGEVAIKLLGDLERSATAVHRKGAVSGPQWSRLSGDLIRSRAFLAAHPSTQEGSDE